MRITIVNKHIEDLIGGSEFQCNLIANELVERGYTVTYIAPDGNQRKYNTAYRVITSENSSRDIETKIIESSPDIVYWRFNKHNFLPVVRSIKQKEIPFIFAASSVNDVNPWFFKKKTGFRKKIKILAKSHWHHSGFRKVDVVTVNNKDYLNKLPVSRQYFVPNGMTSDYVPFNWEKPYCAWVSSIKQIKRPEMMIRLAEDLEPEGIDFIMVGNIQEEKYEWINDPKNLPPNLFYLGGKTPAEVSGILKKSILHIHTCLPEGFPNVFIQAWMQGTPSVSLGFDPGGYISSNHIGYSTNEDWNTFKSKITYLLQIPELRVKMGENARKFAQKMFSPDKTVSKLEEIFKSLVR